MAKFAVDLKEGKLVKNDGVIVGIDLGTTNSLVTYVINGEPKCVTDSGQKHTLVPSIVHFKEDGDSARKYLVAALGRTMCHCFFRLGTLR